MSSRSESPKSYVAGEDLEQFRAVKLTANVNEVIYADAGDTAIGITEEKVSQNDHVAVRLLGHSGTFSLTAGAAFSYGDNLEIANDGKVIQQSGNPTVFIAQDAASADGSIVEGLKS